MTDRTARVSRAGAGLFVTYAELREAGVNPDDGEVSYEIDDGEIRLNPDTETEN